MRVDREQVGHDIVLPAYRLSAHSDQRLRHDDRAGRRVRANAATGLRLGIAGDGNAASEAGAIQLGRFLFTRRPALRREFLHDCWKLAHRLGNAPQRHVECARDAFSKIISLKR